MDSSSEKMSQIQRVLGQENGTLYDSESVPIIESGTPLPQLTKGLTAFTAAVFIIGEMAGSGVLALPYAMVHSGYTGFAMLLLGCLASGYCGIVLGWSWAHLRQTCPEYREHVRYPYPAIAEKAVGKWMARVVTVCINITLLGVCVVFLILASQNLSKLITSHVDWLSSGNQLRIWLLICAAFLLPCSWLGTPIDFWGIAIGATLATALACLLVCVAIGLQMPINLASVEQPPVTFSSFFAAFGTILFSFGGASTFPTIQTDMKDGTRFPLSVAWAYAGVLGMYLPVSILGFLAYGAGISENVLLSVSHNGTNPNALLIDFVLALITVHLLFSFVIVLNPVSQQFEEMLNLPSKFSWQRCVLRSCLLLFILGIAEAVPKFGPILSLIGGSTVTLLTFVFPCWFYLKIFKNIPLHIQVLLLEFIALGLFGGVASTYSAIDAIRKTF